MPNPIVGMVGAQVVSSAIGAGASYFGSKNQADAMRDTAAMQKQMFDQAMAKVAPYIDFGQALLPTLKDLLVPGKDMNAVLEQLPGYKFTSTQGLKAVSNLATMRGLSGNAMREGADFATGLASNTWDKLVGRIMEGAKMGSDAARTGIGAAGEFGKMIGGARMGAGAAEAGGIMGGAGQVQGGINNLANMFMVDKLTGGKMFGSGGPDQSASSWASPSPYDAAWSGSGPGLTAF